MFLSLSFTLAAKYLSGYELENLRKKWYPMQNNDALIHVVKLYFFQCVNLNLKIEMYNSKFMVKLQNYIS